MKVEPETNTVVVGAPEDLLQRAFTVDRVNWLAQAGQPLQARVQIRYHHPAAPATVTPLAGGRARVDFETSQAAVTPGQVAVFYSGDEVLGGGWIEASPALPPPATAIR